MKIEIEIPDEDGLKLWDQIKLQHGCGAELFGVLKQIDRQLQEALSPEWHVVYWAFGGAHHFERYRSLRSAQKRHDEIMNIGAYQFLGLAECLE